MKFFTIFRQTTGVQIVILNYKKCGPVEKLLTFIPEYARMAQKGVQRVKKLDFDETFCDNSEGRGGETAKREGKSVDDKNGDGSQ